jgi:hypothetical protein
LIYLFLLIVLKITFPNEWALPVRVAHPPGRYGTSFNQTKHTMTMTLITQIRRWIGLMPSGYAFYKTRGLYLLTFKGYRAGIAASSHRQLREQAWEHFRGQVPDIKNKRPTAKDVISEQVRANRTAGRKIHVA